MKKYIQTGTMHTQNELCFFFSSHQSLLKIQISLWKWLTTKKVICSKKQRVWIYRRFVFISAPGNKTELVHVLTTRLDLQNNEEKKRHLKQHKICAYFPDSWLAECWELSTSLVVLLVDRDVLFHIIRGSQDNRDSLMDSSRLDVQNVFRSCGGDASCLHHDEGHGVALIQQPQLENRTN